jgi:HK97 family phage major capsid protein
MITEKLNARRRERAETQAALDALLAEANADGRILDAEEKLRSDGYKDRIRALDSEILGLQDAEQRTREILEQEHGGSRATLEPGQNRGTFAPGRRRSLREMFEAAGTRLSNDGFASFEEFMRVIANGRHDPRLRAAGGFNEGTPPEGGFFVPTQLAVEMLDKAVEESIVMPRARIYPMETSNLDIAGWDALDNSGAAPFGGFEMSWLAEGAAATRKKGKTRRIGLAAKRGAVYTYGTDELIADALNFEQMLNDALPRSIAWGMDYKFFTGTGAGCPLGVLNDPALLTVTKETGQPAATIQYENLTKMFARLHPGCVSNSVWVANATAIPQLLTLGIMLGVGGTAVPVLRETTGGWTLLTRPVVFTEKLPALGTKGDIILADFSQYAIGLRAGVTVQKTQAIGWLEGETDFRAVVRVDGQGKWSAPFTPLNGDTLSWCVALATRS